MKLIQGNEACALGAMRAGCRFFAGYPITPATEIMEWMARLLPPKRGVFIQIAGPCLETPAETRAYRHLGADAIGMSTAIEAIAAHHMGLRILGLSCLTNKNLPDCMEPTTHEQVLETAGRAASAMSDLIEALAAALPGLQAGGAPV